MKSPPPPPPPITSSVPKRTDNRGIPIVQTSPLNRPKRTMQDEEDEIRLCSVQRNVDYFARTYSPSRPIASSPRLDSWQDASTEPMFPHQKKLLFSPRPQPSIYMNRKLKRKADDFGLNSPCSKVSRISNSQEQKLDDTPPATQPERMFEIEKMSERMTEPPKMIESIIEPLKMIESIVEPPKMIERIVKPPKMIESIIKPPKIVEPQKMSPEIHEPEIHEPEIHEPEIHEPEDMIIDPPNPVDTIDSPPTETRKPTKEEEKARVAEEIDHLMKTVKCLPNYYKLTEKIGEGNYHYCCT